MSRLLHCFIWFATFPYYWTLRHFTVLPIQRIVNNHKAGIDARQAAVRFFRGKSEELTLVTVGATLSAAATIGVFSWPAIVNTTWVAWACWYLSLILSIFSIIMSAQHSAIIYTIRGIKEDTPISASDMDRVMRMVSCGNPSRDGITTSTPNQSVVTKKSPAGHQPGSLGQSIRVNYGMVYVWQSPVMLMAWSWGVFILGLALHVTAPLRHDEQTGNNRQSAIFVLLAGGIVILNFAWCSFWMYRTAGHLEEEEMSAKDTISNC